MAEQLFDNEFLKKLEYLELIARRLVFGKEHAQRISSRKGASIEFKDFREYTPGDDPRSVDWSVYARLGELVVKLYRQEQELDLVVLLDKSSSMRFGDPDKFNYAQKLSAALAYIGMCNMDSASVIPMAGTIDRGRGRVRGRGAIFRLLEEISAIEPGGTTDIAASVRSLVARVKRPGLVVLISDFYGLQNAQQAIDQLRFQKHQVYVVQVASPWELNPQIRGELRMIDVETKDASDLVVTDSLLKKYKAAYEQFGTDLRRYCMKYAIGCSLAPTDVPFDEFLTNVLQRGGLVA